ncbi:MAG: hypothetical protein HYX48_05420 [Chlamydiales bacterium]|nr:hypothetical protein [Chlamydiales bacterium]
MGNLSIKNIKNLIIVSAISCMALAQCNLSAAEAPKANRSKDKNLEMKTSWQEYHSTIGSCSMLFPRSPEHVSEKMSDGNKEGFDLKYDAYIANVDKKSVFMLLIAQYPDFVDESYAQISLESFLNGLLSHNPANQLIFADLVLVGGREALDFFIRTGSVFFKGRAMMVKNSLYLMAMECEMQHYDEADFDQFINSFKLVKK